MQLVQLCKQFHTISFPEIPLHMQKKLLRDISLVPYLLSNNFREIYIFVWQEKLSNRKRQYIR
jgi:hypothetical protein